MTTSKVERPKHLRRKYSLIARLVLLLCSAVVVFAALEIFFSFHIPRNGLTPYRTSTIGAVPYELRPDFDTLYFNHELHINSLGFRGREFSKSPQGMRIALVGDSFTFGLVASEDTLPVRVEQWISEAGGDAEVLNCGIPGYSADHVAIMLHNRVLEFEPDIVIYVFCFNDTPQPDPTIPLDVDPDSVFEFRRLCPCRSAFLRWSSSRIAGLSRALGMDLGEGYVSSELRNFHEGGRDRLKEAISAMRQDCDQRKVRFMVARAPAMFHRDANPYAEIAEELATICSELDVSYVDLGDAFEPTENLADLRVGLFDGHPNREANDRMARQLAQVLSSELGHRAVTPEVE